MLGSSDVCACLAVKDMAEAAKFYGETLGLETGMETPGGTFYKSGNSGIFVYPSHFAGSNQATAASWRVDDVPGVVADLESKGISFEQYDDIPGASRDGAVHSMGELQSAWFKDPDGNILNIVNQMS